MSAHASPLIPQPWEASACEWERNAPTIGRSRIRRSCSRRVRDVGDRFIDGRDHQQVAVESGHAQDAPYQRSRRGEHHLRPQPRLTVLQVKKHAQAGSGEQPDPGEVENHIAVGQRAEFVAKLQGGQEIDLACYRRQRRDGGSANSDDQRRHRSPHGVRTTAALQDRVNRSSHPPCLPPRQGGVAALPIRLFGPGRRGQSTPGASLRRSSSDGVNCGS